MWWDWAKTTLMDSFLFSILTILILYFVGWGFTRLVCVLIKKFDPLGCFDTVQKITFRVFLGICFIVLFVTLFSFFNFPFWLSTFLVVVIASVGAMTFFRKPHWALSRIRLGCRNYLYVVVAVVVLSVIFLLSLKTSGFYTSTNDDGAFHTLLIKLITDHPNVLANRSVQPFAAVFRGFPVGEHIVGGFLVTFFNVALQKIVLMMSVTLPALIALSFYSTIRCLFDNRVVSIIGLIISAFLTIGLFWVPVSWGGMSVLFSFYLSVCSIGLIFTFLLKTRMSVLVAFLLGLISFAALEVYPDILLIVFSWFVLFLFLKLYSKFKRRRSLRFLSFSLSLNSLFFALAFLLPLLLSFPYLSFFYSNVVGGAHFNDLNMVSSPFADVVKSQISFNWVLDLPALSVFFTYYDVVLVLTPISLIILIALFIPRVSQRLSHFLSIKEFRRSLLFVYSSMLLLMTYLTLAIFVPINLLLNLLDSERVLQHVFLPAIILTSVVLFFLFQFLFLALKRFLSEKEPSFLRIRKRNIVASVSLILLSIVLISFFSISIITKERGQLQVINNNFSVFQTVMQDDISLMKWIKQNTLPNSRLLTSAGDSGQFIGVITDRFEISQFAFLKNYTDLMAILTFNASDFRAVPLLIEYNVNYVYIGSTATTYALDLPYYRTFNATQLSSTPYFSLTKQIGDAWLFQFNATKALEEYNETLN